MKLIAIAVAVMAAALALPGQLQAQGATDPAAALSRLGAALSAGNVDAAVALFNDDGSVVSATQGGESFVGKDRVRVWAQRLVDGHFRVDFTGSNLVQGNRVVWPSWIWLDAYRNLDVTPAEVIVSLELRGDKIQTFTSMLGEETDARLKENAAKVAAVTKLFDALNAGDINATMATLTSDIHIIGANGSHVIGTAEVQTYYTGLIAGHLRLTPYGSAIVNGDRVTLTYGLAVDALRTLGIPAGETVGSFYIRNGKIAALQATYTPMTQAAISAAMNR